MHVRARHPFDFDLVASLATMSSLGVLCSSPVTECFPTWESHFRQYLILHFGLSCHRVFKVKRKRERERERQENAAVVHHCLLRSVWVQTTCVGGHGVIVTTCLRKVSAPVGKLITDPQSTSLMGMMPLVSRKYHLSLRLIVKIQRPFTVNQFDKLLGKLVS